MKQPVVAPVVALVAFNQFSSFHFSVPCIIFKDIMPEQPLFDLRVCAGEVGELKSNAGLQITPEYDVTGLRSADIVIVPFWRNPAERPPQPLLDELRKAYDRGAQIVGLCLGTYVVAYAGLLSGRKASTHWEFEQDFQQRFPDVTLDSNSLYVDSGNIVTSAGTGAGLDCCLYLVRQQYGSEVANKVARRMVIPPYRNGGQAQFIDRPVPKSTPNSRINELLDHLRLNLGESHSLDELAERVMMTRRTFSRQFQKATGMSVGDWLVNERLRFSQDLLESTDLSIEVIASQCGFNSALSLRNHFKAQFNVSPSEWRKTFRGEPTIQ
jgi:transcriptional regulator GlxA family with amidase domain